MHASRMLKMAVASAAPVLLAVALPLTNPLTNPVWADDQDHNRARQALMDGSVLPLADILAKVQKQYPGQVLEVELEPTKRQAGPEWIYEIKILSADGQLSKLRVNARTAEVLAARSRHLDRLRDRR